MKTRFRFRHDLQYNTDDEESERLNELIFDCPPELLTVEVQEKKFILKRDGVKVGHFLRRDLQPEDEARLVTGHRKVVGLDYSDSMAHVLVIFEE